MDERKDHATKILGRSLTLTELEPHLTIDVEANDTYLTFGDALYPGQGHRTQASAGLSQKLVNKQGHPGGGGSS